jgi:hypothetical protein
MVPAVWLLKKTAVLLVCLPSEFWGQDRWQMVILSSAKCLWDSKVPTTFISINFFSL